MESGRAWAVPWHCLFEFLAVVTHLRVYKPATPLQQALEQIRVWKESPTLVLLGENESMLIQFATLAQNAQCSGGMIYDARIASLCIAHGVSELWTADRDFSRFPKLKTRNPLIVS